MALAWLQADKLGSRCRCLALKERVAQGEELGDVYVKRLKEKLFWRYSRKACSSYLRRVKQSEQRRNHDKEENEHDNHQLLATYDVASNGKSCYMSVEQCA